MFQVIGLTYTFVTKSLQQKLMKMDTMAEIVTTKIKRRKVIKQEFCCKFILELILAKKISIFLEPSMKHLGKQNKNNHTKTSLKTLKKIH